MKKQQKTRKSGVKSENKKLDTQNYLVSQKRIDETYIWHVVDTTRARTGDETLDNHVFGGSKVVIFQKTEFF